MNGKYILLTILLILLLTIPSDAVLIIQPYRSTSSDTTIVTKVMDLDGTDDLFDGTDIAALDSATQLTVATWIYLDGATADGVVTKANGTSDGWIIWRDNSGVSRDNTFVMFVADSSDSSNTRLEMAENAAATGSFLHVVFTLDLTGNDLRGYIGGSEDANSPVDVSAIAAIDAGANVVKVGIWPDGSSELDGKMGEVAIWDKELTSANVTTLYNGGTFVYDKPLSVESGNLVAYWKFPYTQLNINDSGDGIVFTDHSANSNTITGDNGANNTGLTCIAVP